GVARIRPLGGLSAMGTERGRTFQRRAHSKMQMRSEARVSRVPPSAKRERELVDLERQLALKLSNVVGAVPRMPTEPAASGVRSYRSSSSPPFIETRSALPTTWRLKTPVPDGAALSPSSVKPLPELR